MSDPKRAPRSIPWGDEETSEMESEKVEEAGAESRMASSPASGRKDSKSAPETDSPSSEARLCAEACTSPKEANIPWVGPPEKTPESSPELSSQPLLQPSPPSESPLTSAVVHPSTTLAPPEEEPFDLPGAAKLGIVGGKGVGKSYLFQAMVYRTYGGPKSGALTWFLERDGIRLFSALSRDSRARVENIHRFLQSYGRWERLLQTQRASQTWYRLRLRYRTGLLGRRRCALDVEFFDASGEGFFAAARNAENSQLWREGYLEARVMVFCLPLWAVFPGGGLSEADWDERDTLLMGFEQVVENFATLRRLHRCTQPVSTILALTQADDRRTGLRALQQQWIHPYMDAPHSYLKELRSGAGVARYLANARRISEALHQEFLAVPDPLVTGIPQRLDFEGGLPWMIPVSAIDGGLLDAVERGRQLEESSHRMRAPVPVHVELPLLVALCRQTNALM